MADKSSTVKIKFDFDEKALKTATSLLKNLTTVMGGLQKKTIATNRSLDALSRKLTKLEKSPLVQKGIKIGGLSTTSGGGSSRSPEQQAKNRYEKNFYANIREEERKKKRTENNTLKRMIAEENAMKKAGLAFTPQGKPDDMLTTNIVDYKKNGAKYEDKKDKAEAKTLKDQKKKQDEDEKKAQLESIRRISAISLAFDLLKSTVNFVVGAFKKLMEIMNKFGESAKRVNDAAFTGNTFGYSTQTVTGFQRGFSGTDLDPAAFEQIATFLAPLRSMAAGNSAEAGRQGYGERMEALAVLTQRGMGSEVDNINKAITAGDEEDMINAVLQLMVKANSLGGSTPWATGQETGLNAITGVDQARYDQIQDFVNQIYVINEEASLEMAGQLEELKVFWQNLMQEHMPMMVEVMKMVNATLQAMKPIFDSIVMIMHSLMQKLGLDNINVEQNAMFSTQASALSSNSAASYFGSGIFEGSKFKGRNALTEAFSADFARNIPDDIASMISTILPEGGSLTATDKYMVKELLNQLTPGVDLNSITKWALRGDVRDQNFAHAFTQVEDDMKITVEFLKTQQSEEQ